MRKLPVLATAYCLLPIAALFVVACRHATAPPVPPAPTPAPAAKFGPTEIWFAPDIGAVDYQTLFSDPSQWAQTRGKVKVFKFYPQLLVPSDACATCGPNKYPALVQAKVPSVMMPGGPTQINPFQALLSWNIQIAIEAPVLKSWTCDGAQAVTYSQQAINTVNQNGGTLAWLMMDEPIYDSTDPIAKECSMSSAQAQVYVLKYLAAMRTANPGLKIGLIEAYPALSAQTLIQWIQVLPIDAFHIDIDHDSPLPTLGPDLGAISAACRAKGIPFGIIFGGQESQPGLDFITGQKAFIQKVLAAYGTPPVTIFQSWDVANVPPTLPESSPVTLTGVVLQSTQ